MLKFKAPPKPPERFTIVVEQGRSGLWYATSPEHKGVLAVGGSREKVMTNTAHAMRALDRAALEARR
jgi:predicted RNase H-like HicB family nuclease